MLKVTQRRGRAVTDPGRSPWLEPSPPATCHLLKEKVVGVQYPQPPRSWTVRLLQDN